MSKAEMLRQSAIEKNKNSLEQLAEQVQTIREAKAQSMEELSAMLEPLAKALASRGRNQQAQVAELEARQKLQRERGIDGPELSR